MNGFYLAKSFIADWIREAPSFGLSLVSQVDFLPSLGLLGLRLEVHFPKLG